MRTVGRSMRAQTPPVFQEYKAMLTIKILGDNTPHTHTVEDHIRTALRWLNPHDGYQVLTVTEPEVVGNLVDRVPGLVINDQVVCKGHIPAASEIVTWASDAMQTMLERKNGHLEDTVAFCGTRTACPLTPLMRLTIPPAP
jgi:hypothetical protein